MTTKYPYIEVNLSKCDGNVFAILGRCQKEARRQGVDNDEIAAFLYEAESRDYDYALQTCFRWFTIT